MSIYAAGTPALPLAEAESLTETLMADLSSRLSAAMNGWSIRLPLWLQIRSVAALSSIAGVAPEWPWGDESGLDVTEDEKAAAEASIRERWAA